MELKHEQAIDLINQTIIELQPTTTKPTTTTTTTIPGPSGLILLTTGYDPSQVYIATSEVVDVLNSASSCQSIPDFPVAAHTAGGGIVNGVPIVCGGNAESAGVQSNCYTLDKDTVQWTLLTDALP